MHRVTFNYITSYHVAQFYIHFHCFEHRNNTVLALCFTLSSSHITLCACVCVYAYIYMCARACVCVRVYVVSNSVYSPPFLFNPFNLPYPTLPYSTLPYPITSYPIPFYSILGYPSMYETLCMLPSVVDTVA